MHKKYLHIIIASTAAIILTGCGGTSKRLYVGPAPEKSFDSPAVKEVQLRFSVSGVSANGASLTIGDSPIDAFWLTLQGAAEDTIKRGDTYFSIYRPKMISNYDGANLTDTNALKLVCVDRMKPQGRDRYIVGNLFSDPDTILCNVTSEGSGYLEYTTSKEKPKDKGAFNAHEVIAYLKANKYYITEYDTASRQIEPELLSGVFVYSDWLKYRRDSDGAK